ncbi:hypothetical protein PHYSODRAFT_289079 [Phytophthora sojae]|uniref:RxLR effector protein n=2 Tax=Phytophthora sojae TaxID=67593 RepID=G5AD73_PHYSP|nr:hypothetical protein PHYSODRAFT_289079 [Phytophthora sojae]AEK80857.1 Avh183 [Phytophthora sojae]AEK80858.1 Avh183 [Phytophthora sojae]AEK80859.1 Avh183 [Phytophthora sojae]EGZ06126.1 hypothetical protein PHYSODRAFT_289079 [Phytophthora sojae]|eukprot:XP_009538023.1 hypothetical protein PHYSODRAFT_289079 [Phytophthora sojae]
MQLTYALLTVLACTLSGCNAESASTDTTMIATDSVSIRSLTRMDTGENQQRFLRTDEGDARDDEERGWKEVVQTVREKIARAKFPAWYASGKTPEKLVEELQLVYPMTKHKNFPIYKSYKTYYDSIHRSYP